MAVNPELINITDYRKNACIPWKKISEERKKGAGNITLMKGTMNVNKWQTGECMQLIKEMVFGGSKTPTHGAMGQLGPQIPGLWTRKLLLSIRIMAQRFITNACTGNNAANFF